MICLPMEIDIKVVIFDGFTNSSLAIILDIFSAANAILARHKSELKFNVKTFANQPSVTSKSGMKIATDGLLEDLSATHVLMLPGVWIEHKHEIEQLLNQPSTQKFIDILKRTDWGDTIIAASCSGGMFLAESGLLDGHHSTVTWWLESHCKQRWPKVKINSAQTLVESGNFITAGAVFSQIDLCLNIISRFGGKPLATECSHILLLRERGAQTADIGLKYLSANDRLVAKAEQWVTKNIANKFDLAQLTNHLGVGSRTFARRLKLCLNLTPIMFVQRIRVEKAIEMLEATTLSVNEISFLVGYDNASSLNKLIRKQTGQTAATLRNASRRASII